MNTVNVSSIIPFWRYAVGPASGLSAAIPFYRLASANALYNEAVRDLPWSKTIIYKRTLSGLVIIRESIPNARP